MSSIPDQIVDLLQTHPERQFDVPMLMSELTLPDNKRQAVYQALFDLSKTHQIQREQKKGGRGSWYSWDELGEPTMPPRRGAAAPSMTAAVAALPATPSTPATSEAEPGVSRETSSPLRLRMDEAEYPVMFAIRDDGQLALSQADGDTVTQIVLGPPDVARLFGFLEKTHAFWGGA